MTWHTIGIMKCAFWNRSIMTNLTTRIGIALVLVITGLSISIAAIAEDGLVPVPHPNLDLLTPEVRRSLAPAINQFEKKLPQESGAELGRAYGKLGLHYQAHQQQAAASACYENAMTLDPESYQWPYYLAVHYEETGEIAKATEFYRRSLGLNPDNVAGATRLGLMLVETGEIDEAEKLLRFVLDADPENAAAFAGLGAIATRREQYDRAAQYYQRALRIQPEAKQLHYRLGMVYRQLGQLDLARQELEQRGQRIPSINDPLLALMQAFQRPATDYIDVGSQAMAQGEFEKAASALTLAINIDPDSSEARIRLGQAYAALDRLPEALQQFEHAVQLDPKNADAHFFMGALYEMQRDDSRAIDAYSAAVTSGSGYPAARLGLANALMREGRYVESAQHYTALAADEAKDGELRFWQGMAWLAAGSCEPAEQALLAAFELSPRSGHVIHALSRVFSICPDADETRRKNALAYAELMYSRDPGLDTSETFAMALAANGMYSDAEELQAQALFEAAKLQDEVAAAGLRKNLQRYQQQMPAEFAWPPNHPVYAPPRMDLNTIR